MSEVSYVMGSPGRLIEAQDQFIQEWARMSSSWGINRTMAQIHALLYITGEALTADEIIDRLQISRGNASMNLRDLMDWGIVRRFRKPGERRDTYVSESDAWQMFAKVVKERKRREIDPTVDAIRESLSRLPDADQSGGAVEFRARLTQLLDIFGMIDLVYQQFVMLDRSQIRDMIESRAKSHE